jgi:hypothetical protein
MMNVKISVATLCDDVRTETGGKVSLMGLFSVFHVGDFTKPLPNFRVFIAFSVDEEGDSPFELTIASENGDFKNVVGGAFSARDRDVVTNDYKGTVSMGIGGLAVPRPGRYSVTFTLSGREIVEIPFLVNVVEPPTRH